MYLSFLTQFVHCTKLILGIRFSHEQKPHYVIFCLALTIIDWHSGYTYIIPSTGEILAAGVIHIFEQHIKPTIGLPIPIVSDPDGLLMAADF